MMGEKPLSGFGARFLPFLGFKGLQPKATAAVYLPGWIIDAEVWAKVWLTNGENDRQVYSLFDISADLGV